MKNLPALLAGFFYVYSKNKMEDLTFEFYILEKTRTNLLKIFTNKSLEELNKIPASFNNNLIWNFAHVVVTQQLLVYGLSKTPMNISKELINKYRKGTKPTDFVEQSEVDYFVEMASSSIQQVKEDYSKNIFGEYKEYSTSYGTTLSSVSQAIKFNNTHEALHLGTCLDLIKFI
jgi:hypothetical protein